MKILTGPAGHLNASFVGDEWNKSTRSLNGTLCLIDHDNQIIGGKRHGRGIFFESLLLFWSGACVANRIGGGKYYFRSKCSGRDFQTVIHWRSFRPSFNALPALPCRSCFSNAFLFIITDVFGGVVEKFTVITCMSSVFILKRRAAHRRQTCGSHRGRTKNNAFFSLSLSCT
jgi:hypothetical protein